MLTIRKLYRYFGYKKKSLPIHPKTIYKQLVVSQYFNSEALKTLQEKAISILCKSLTTSPYYKSYPIDKDNISNDEFLKLPQISKSSVKKNKEQMCTKFFTNKHMHTTSGSTGDPLIMYLSGIAEVYRLASVMRFLSWWGCTVTDKSVLIWGRRNVNSNKKIISKFKSILRGRLDICVFDLSEETIHYYYDKIEKYHPQYIRGYKSALFQLAELMEKNNLSFRKTHLKVAIVTSEVLYDSERLFIEKIFSCPVANEYGAAEAGQFAYECPQGGMHINEESVLFMCDDNNNVIVTEMWNNSMPLVNYRIGDKAKLSGKICSCGRRLKMLDHIKGRESEYIKKPNGEKLSQYVIYYIMGDLKDVGFKNTVLKYKVYQNENNFTVNIIPGAGFSEQVEKYIIEQMYKKIGNSIKVEVVKVKSIPRDKSGKLSFFDRTTNQK